MILLALLAGYAQRARTLDWDVLAYAACAEELSGESAEEVHAAVYASLAEHAPPADVARLRGEPDLTMDADLLRYRQRMADDPRAFHAQLPFYRGRVLFIAALAIAHSLGVDALHAAFIASLVSGLVFAWILLRWANRYLPPLAALTVAAIVVVASGAPHVMAMGTPDMLSSALLIGAAYTLVEVQRHKTGLALLLLAVATRPDHALLAGALLAWLALAPLPSLRPSTPGLALALALLLLVQWFGTVGRGSHDWWTVFHHSFVEYVPFPRENTPARDLRFAAARVLRSLPMFLALRPLCFTLAAAAAVALGWRARRWNSAGGWLAALSGMAGLAHFALFPALWPRLMLPYWTLCSIGLCMAWAERGERAESAAQDAAAPPSDASSCRFPRAT